MGVYLLVDFGATRIKTALTGGPSWRINHIRVFQPPPGCSPGPGRYEIPPEALRRLFNKICRHYQKLSATPIKGILMCSQMHGFLLTDSKDRALTPYISWRDERSLFSVRGMRVFERVCAPDAPDFRGITGMRPRPGLPFMNAIHVARENRLKGVLKVVTLPEWLAGCDGESDRRIHPTMAAGLGFFDIAGNKFSDALCAMARDLSGAAFAFNKTGSEGDVAGWRGPGSARIPIFTGVGDHPCAVLGAGNQPKETLSVNIGTGSQAAVIEGKRTRKAELRPYFGGSMLSTITHIPAGRALETFLAWIPDPWRAMSALTCRDILDSTLEIDLALFKSAWNYDGGGKISAIGEGSINMRNYLGSLLRCLLLSEAQAVEVLANRKGAQRVILSGGIPRRLPVMAAVLAGLTGRPVAGAASVDETLLGLRLLARAVAGEAPPDSRTAGAGKQ